jgi:transposase
MSYTSSPYAAKARFEAARLVVKEGLKASQVAIMYGVHRATIGKWVRRFPRRLNQYGHFISTLSSAPNHHPRQTPDEVIDRIIELREKLKGRCAPVIHAHLISEGYKISARTVGRVLKKEGLIRKKKLSRFLKSCYPRPEANLPGDLVQMDTIHVMRGDGSRYYHLHPN